MIQAKSLIFFRSTKNEKERYMPLSDEIVNLLMRVKSVQKKYGFDLEHIFVNENGRMLK